MRKSSANNKVREEGVAAAPPVDIHAAAHGGPHGLGQVDIP